jgi:hypothetical protein
MKAKRSVLAVAVCVGVVGLSATLCATSISPINWKWHSNWVADGGAPMPPWPPNQTSKTTLIADGGAPMPPWPTAPSPNRFA